MAKAFVVIVANQAPRGFADAAQAESFVRTLPMGVEYFRGQGYNRTNQGWYRRGDGRTPELTTAAPCWATGDVSVEVVTL